MPRFSSFLRRTSGVELPSSSSSQPRYNQEALPREIRLNLPNFNIANAAVPEITIGCWLNNQDLQWGLHQNQNIAILHLVIEAEHPDHFDIKNFRIELEFSTQPSSIPELLEIHQIAAEDAEEAETDIVYLWRRPAPLHVPPEPDSKWQFTGRLIPPPDGGPATAVRWEWSVLRPPYAVMSCGSLHCGVVIRHGGPGRHLLIKYHVIGRAREMRNEVYTKPYTFTSKAQDVSPWLLRPPPATINLTKQDIDDLETRVVERYRGPFAAGGAVTEDLAEASKTTTAVAPTNTVAGHYYGQTDNQGVCNLILQGNPQNFYDYRSHVVSLPNTR